MPKTDPSTSRWSCLATLVWGRACSWYITCSGMCATVLVCVHMVDKHIARCMSHYSVLANLSLVYRLLRVAWHSPAWLANMPAACHVADQHHGAVVCTSLVPCLLDIGRHDACFLVKATHACCSAYVHGMLAYRHLHDGHEVLWHARGYYHFTPVGNGVRVQRLTEDTASQVALATNNFCLSIIQHSECT